MDKFSVMARQGDVVIKRIDKLPEESTLVPVPQEKGKVVLAHGEVTGHMHAISEPFVHHFRMAVDTQSRLDESMKGSLPGGWFAGDTFLKVAQTVVLRHDEHAPVEIPPGDYVVRRQREYKRSVHRVAD
jgi:hypothetical protein